VVRSMDVDAVTRGRRIEPDHTWVPAAVFLVTKVGNALLQAVWAAVETPTARKRPFFIPVSGLLIGGLDPRMGTKPADVGGFLAPKAQPRTAVLSDRAYSPVLTLRRLQAVIFFARLNVYLSAKVPRWLGLLFETDG